jgi:hypothetical protein
VVNCGDKSNILDMHNEFLLTFIRAPGLDWRDNTDPNVCRDGDVNLTAPGQDAVKAICAPGGSPPTPPFRYEV